MKSPVTFGLLAVLPLLAACHQRQRIYHSDCATPPASFQTANDGIGHLRPYVTITIAPDGAIGWAGSSISNDQLVAYVRGSSRLNPTPQIVLDAAPTAPCDEVEHVRSVMLASQTCKGDVPLCSEGNDPKHWPIVGGP